MSSPQIPHVEPPTSIATLLHSKLLHFLNAHRAMITKRADSLTTIDSANIAQYLLEGQNLLKEVPGVRASTDGTDSATLAAVEEIAGRVQLMCLWFGHELAVLELKEALQKIVDLES